MHINVRPPRICLYDSDCAFSSVPIHNFRIRRIDFVSFSEWRELLYARFDVLPAVLNFLGMIRRGDW